MESNLSSKVTEGIRVNVRNKFQVEESSPRHHYYVFAYQVEIINESPYPVQLITREWHIIDGFGGRRVVKGEGVIGKQPRIAPGERYVYVSGTHFPSAVGKMQGHYTMVREIDQAQLRVQIPPFVMMAPFINN